MFIEICRVISDKTEIIREETMDYAFNNMQIHIQTARNNREEEKYRLLVYMVRAGNDGLYRTGNSCPAFRVHDWR